MQDVLYVVAAPLLCFWSFCSCEYPDMTASTCVHGLKSKPLWSLAFPKLKIKATAQNVVKQIEAVRRRLLQIGCDAAFATTRFSWNGAAIDFVIVCIFFPPCLNAGYIFRFVVAQLCRNKKKFFLWHRCKILISPSVINLGSCFQSWSLYILLRAIVLSGLLANKKMFFIFAEP